VDGVKTHDAAFRWSDMDWQPATGITAPPSKEAEKLTEPPESPALKAAMTSTGAPTSCGLGIGNTDTLVGNFTYKVKACMALGATPFVATMVRWYVPLVPDLGEPEMVASPF
jgi:hypothetical protein